jgi:hypothetical protein
MLAGMVLSGAAAGHKSQAAQSNVAQQLKAAFFKGRRTDELGLTSGKLIADFLDVAFTDSVFANEDTRRGIFEGKLTTLYPNTHYNPVAEAYARNFPHLAPYIYRRDPWPKSDVINKWSSKITIGIGFPPGLNTFSKGEAALRSILEDQITLLLPALRKATGTDVTYIKPEEETANSYARIRILVDHGLPSTGLDEPGIGIQPEEMLWGQISFDDTGSGYGGSILPQSDNTLGFAYCFIQSREPMPIVRSLINRCLLRAMGLPNISSRKIATVLGKEGLPKKWPTEDHPIDTSENPSAPRPTLSPYDLEMLSLLYCPSVKPGMSKNEVIQVLAQRKECPIP